MKDTFLCQFTSYPTDTFWSSNVLLYGTQSWERNMRRWWGLRPVACYSAPFTSTKSRGSPSRII